MNIKKNHLTVINDGFRSLKIQNSKHYMLMSHLDL